MKKQRQIFILTILSLSIILVSCIDVRKELSAPTSAGSQIHEQGWTIESSANFHGKAIEEDAWRMTSCNKCHGSDYRGGSSGVSCLTCHSQPGGPENCATCHGGTNAAPPKDLSGNTATSSTGVGAHQSHLLVDDTVFTAVACNECHTVPASLSSAGHIDSTRAKILFNGSVVTSPLAALAGSDKPVYSYTTLKCENTYCHGYFPNGNRQSTTWNNTTGQYSACGSCHGDPTKNTIRDRALPKTQLTGGFHPNNIQCSSCHQSAINANNKLNISKHLNGQIDFN